MSDSEGQHAMGLQATPGLYYLLCRHVSHLHHPHNLVSINLADAANLQMYRQNIRTAAYSLLGAILETPATLISQLTRMVYHTALCLTVITQFGHAVVRCLTHSSVVI